MLRDITKEVLASTNIRDNRSNTKDILKPDNPASKALFSHSSSSNKENNPNDLVYHDSHSNLLLSAIPHSKFNDESFKLSLINNFLKPVSFSPYNSVHNKKMNYFSRTDSPIISRKHFVQSAMKKYSSFLSFEVNSNEIQKFKIYKDDDVLSNSYAYHDIMIENEVDEDCDSDSENIRNGERLCRQTIKEAFKLQKRNPMMVSRRLVFKHN